MRKKGTSARLRRDTTDHLAFKYFALGCLIVNRELTIETFKRPAIRIGLRPTADIFYKSQRVAKLFKRSELESLCRKRRNGRRISWTHVLELLQLPSSTEREEFAAMAARENLGCISLRVEIRRMGDWTSRRPGAGRKRREPRSEADAVWRAHRESERLKATLEWLQENSERKWSNNLEKKLSSAVVLLGRLLNALKNNGKGQADP